MGNGCAPKPKPQNNDLKVNADQLESGPTIKILVVGDPGCGKTSLLLRFTDNVFGNDALMSQFDNKTKDLVVFNRNIKVQVWDTAGQENFKAITSSYYRGANGILIMFDLTNEESFSNVQLKWVVEVDNFSDGKATKMLIGTKCDLTGERQVKREDAEYYARRAAMDYLETSAFTPTNVTEVFKQICQNILEEMDDE